MLQGLEGSGLVFGMLLMAFFSSLSVIQNDFISIYISKSDKKTLIILFLIIAVTYGFLFPLILKKKTPEHPLIVLLTIAASGSALLYHYLKNRDILPEGIDNIFDVENMAQKGAFSADYYAAHSLQAVQVSRTVLFFGMAAVIATFIISVLVRKYILMLLVPASAFGVSVFMQKETGKTIILAMILMVLISERLKRLYGKKMLLPDRNILNRSVAYNTFIKISAELAVFLMILILGGIAIGPLSAKPINLTDKYYKKVNSFQKRLESFFKGKDESVDYHDDYTVTNDSPKYDYEEVMSIISSEKPEGNIYLREHTAGHYVMGNWNNSDSTFNDEIKKMTISEQDAQKYINSNIYRYFYSSVEGSITNYVIQNKNKGSRMMLPYFYDARVISSPEYVADYSAKKKKNLKEYNVTALNDSIFLKTFYLDEYEYDKDVLKLLKLCDYYEEPLSSESGFWMWYNDYVDRRYTDIPYNIRDELEAFLKNDEYKELCEYMVDMDYSVNMSRIYKANTIARLLSIYCNYSWNLDRIDETTDPVIYFLSSSKAGYCMHFASAGVLLLRKAGVPARLATGYIVKKDSFKENSEGEYEASVTDNSGHAWAEIYLDNIGWIPVEMTAAYSSESAGLPTGKENMAQNNLHNGIQQESESTEKVSEKTEKITTENTTEKNTEAASEKTDTEERLTDSDDSGDAGRSVKKYNTKKLIHTVVIIVIVIDLILISVLVTVLQRKRLDKRIRESIDQGFRGTDGREKLKKLNYKLYKRLRRRNKDIRGGITDEEYLLALKQGLSDVEEDKIIRYTEILQKVYYTETATLGDNEDEIAREVIRGGLYGKIYNGT
ncbi:Transglutaminase-like superfamily protein [Eubacterium ruminantium]|nr:Transglutaminase-like superfamily protein [Eubacterium ruminantium]